MKESKINVADWIPLVWHVAKRFPAFRVPFVDRGNVIGTMMERLIDCAAEWDAKHKSGANFMTFAFRCLKWAACDELRRERNWRHVKRPRSRLTSPRVMLFSELGDSYVRGRAPAFARPDDTSADFEFREAVRAVLDAPFRGLDGRTRLVFELRNGYPDEMPLTLEAIGKRLGITREQVRQMQARAARNIRRKLEMLGSLALAKELAGIYTEER